MYPRYMLFSTSSLSVNEVALSSGCRSRARTIIAAAWLRLRPLSGCSTLEYSEGTSIPWLTASLIDPRAQ